MAEAFLIFMHIFNLKVSRLFPDPLGFQNLQIRLRAVIAVQKDKDIVAGWWLMEDSRLYDGNIICPVGGRNDISRTTGEGSLFLTGNSEGL